MITSSWLPPSGSALVAAAPYLDRTAVVSADRRWTWRDVHAASVALSARLGGTATVCNLCDSRVGFLITWLAALRQARMQFLPPSGGSADLTSMLAAGTDPCVVVDDPELLRSGWMSRARHVLLGAELERTSRADAPLAWAPDWSAKTVCLFTSGSTGQPEPHYRSLAQLAWGATLLGGQLDEEVDGGVRAIGSIVCSVPAQHMYGVEASVMLSMVHGIPVLDRRPLLPADVRAAFESCEEGSAWVATPLHLRGLVRSGESVPNCRVVIASTMPMAPSLAAQVEERVQAPVLEIYGSTETGAIAMRRPAREASWKPLAQVRLESTAAGTRVWGPHFPSPAQLADHIEQDARGTFALLGRQTDLIKIGGRRASLSGLNQLLQELPGLDEGVFYLPDCGLGTDRLVLIHAGEPLDREAAERWLRERVDPAFLPRAIISVEHLPRTGPGKIARSTLDDIYRNWLARGRSK